MLLLVKNNVLSLDIVRINPPVESIWNVVWFTEFPNEENLVQYLSEPNLLAHAFVRY